MIYEDIPNYRPTGIRDTARVAAQVVTGIGFIGAGTVLRNGPTVFGLTTAATLFVAAAIGMAFAEQACMVLLFLLLYCRLPF